MEEWRDIVGYEGKYLISNIGRIKSLWSRGKKRELLLRPCIDPQGYYFIRLYKDGKIKALKVARLECEAFYRSPLPREQVDHKDGNRRNNRLENLEWVTHKENIKRIYLNDRRIGGGIVKLTWKDVANIRELYNQGTDIDTICDKYNTVGKAHIVNIIKGKSWKFSL